MMEQRICWLKWKLTEFVLHAYIKLHRIWRAIERRWVERKGPKTTWKDVSKRMWKLRGKDDSYFRRLGHMSQKADACWLRYMDVKYRR